MELWYSMDKSTDAVMVWENIDSITCLQRICFSKRFCISGGVLGTKLAQLENSESVLYPESITNSCFSSHLIRLPVFRYAKHPTGALVFIHNWFGFTLSEYNMPLTCYRVTELSLTYRCRPDHFVKLQMLVLLQPRAYLRGYQHSR